MVVTISLLQLHFHNLTVHSTLLQVVNISKVASHTAVDFIIAKSVTAVDHTVKYFMQVEAAIHIKLYFVIARLITAAATATTQTAKCFIGAKSAQLVLRSSLATLKLIAQINSFIATMSAALQLAATVSCSKGSAANC